MPSAAARAVPEPVGYSRHQTMRLESGSRLGPYEISGPLGAGGMGEVYRARDIRLGREVAIKVLPHDLSNDRDRLARFEREARSASALNHRNIVTIHDFASQETNAPTAPQVSHSGLVLGTASYMSPEQARGQDVDFRTDQFSFGLILYEMATGKNPFRRATPMDTIAAILNDEAPSLGEPLG